MTIYASRTAESLNSDPEPEVNPDGTRAAIGEGRATYGPGPFGVLIKPIHYAPRPEYTPETTHAANPILAEMRDENWYAEDVLHSLDRGDWDETIVTHSEIAHARAVLSRLAAFRA